MGPLAPCCAGLIALALSAPAPQPVYTRHPSFRVPLQLDTATRRGLRAIQLHVRRPPHGWQLQQTVPPECRAITFHAPRDGDYWFRFGLIDRAGHEAPARVDGTAALIVIVDTQPPEVDVHPVPVASGAVYLQCNVRDAHPDYATVRLEYQLADHSWKPLPAVADSPGMFQVPDERILIGRVRASAADKAGNTVCREIDLGHAGAVRDE